MRQPERLDSKCVVSMNVGRPGWLVEHCFRLKFVMIQYNDGCNICFVDAVSLLDPWNTYSDSKLSWVSKTSWNQHVWQPRSFGSNVPLQFQFDGTETRAFPCLTFSSHLPFLLSIITALIQWAVYGSKKRMMLKKVKRESSVGERQLCLWFFPTIWLASLFLHWHSMAYVYVHVYVVHKIVGLAGLEAEEFNFLVVTFP